MSFMKGLAKAEPVWLKTMQAPPALFPRADEIKQIALPEDVYVKKFFQKYLDSKHEDAIKIFGFDPPSAHFFSQRVLELKESGVSEEEAMAVADIYDDEVQQVLCNALEEISSEKHYQEKCLSILVHALQSFEGDMSQGKHDADQSFLFSRYQLTVSSMVMASLPQCFPDILHWYFKRKLEEISTMMDDSPDKDDMDLDDKSTCVKAGEMDIDEGHHQGKFLDEVVKNIGKVVRDLRGLGFTSMTKDAYASAISCFERLKYII
ncbi:hypothetical protein ACJRO7_033915 [Eucalyptus globulus]|uniref:Small ribosomal subunit protein mS23 n=1 Tax=Eucalyptus globulus TaxID=34317 RepID=A0ABD3J5K7_EUCGL